MERMRVVFRPMFSTVPEKLSTTTKSSDLEGFVEHDGQAGEQVAQNVLQGQAHRNAAHAQTGQQGGDVEAEVIEQQQKDQRPQHQPGDETHRGQAGGGFGVVRDGALARDANPEIEKARHPQPDLQKQRHGRQSQHPFAHRVRQAEALHCRVKADERGQRQAGALHRVDQRIVPMIAGVRGQGADPRHQNRLDHGDQHHHQNEPAQRQQPALQRIVQKGKG